MHQPTYTDQDARSNKGWTSLSCQVSTIVAPYPGTWHPCGEQSDILKDLCLIIPPWSSFQKINRLCAPDMHIIDIYIYVNKAKLSNSNFHQRISLYKKGCAFPLQVWFANCTSWSMQHVYAPSPYSKSLRFINFHQFPDIKTGVHLPALPGEKFRTFLLVHLKQLATVAFTAHWTASLKWWSGKDLTDGTSHGSGIPLVYCTLLDLIGIP